MRIARMGSEIFYLVKTSANAMPVAFKAIGCENQQVTFSNPKHDFPKSLIYSREHPSQMKVVVGAGSDSEFTLEFTLQFTLDFASEPAIPY